MNFIGLSRSVFDDLLGPLNIRSQVDGSVARMARTLLAQCRDDGRWPGHNLTDDGSRHVEHGHGVERTDGRD